jgi:hypothetical protein
MTPKSRRICYIWIPGTIALAILSLGDAPRTWLEKTLSPSAVYVLTAFLHEGSMAVLIAAILALTFEEISKNEFQQMQQTWKSEFNGLAESQRIAITKDVFVAVFGSHIPDTIRQEIIQQIFWSKLARKEVHITYTLSVIPEDPEFVLIHIDASYELHNTLEPVSLPLTLGIDRAPIRKLEDQVKLITLKVDGCEPPLVFTEDDLALRPDGEQMRFTLDSIGKSAKVINTQPTVVTFAVHSVEERRHGHRETIFTQHICDMDLTLIAEGELANLLKVSASVTAGKLEPLQTDETPGIYKWKLSRPLLPGQALNVRWRLQEPVLPAPTVKSQVDEGSGALK